MEKVSVVITTYKRTKELHRAIQSVTKQNYPNMELIVVDDNTDLEISKMVREIIVPYKDIIYLKNKVNMGGALSRNEGLKAATGKYIAFLDDDDMYMPDKIRKQVECFENTEIENVGVVYCHTIAVDREEQVIESYKKNVRGEFLFESMAGTVAATSQWLCLKEAVEKIGGFKAVPSKQDTTLLFDLALAGYRIDVVPEILTKYYELDIERISGVAPKNLKGELMLREYMRSHYSLLTKTQIRQVEYNITFRIYYLQMRLKEYVDAAESLLLLWKCHINVFATLIMTVKHPVRVILRK